MFSTFVIYYNANVTGYSQMDAPYLIIATHESISMIWDDFINDDNSFQSISRYSF